MSQADIIDLFLRFCALSLVAVGGALATASDMHRYLVEDKHWLSASQFADSVSLAQVAPGPNILFVTVLGIQAAGFWGAVATTVGILLPSSVVVLCGYRLRKKYEHTDAIKALGIGLAPLALGLIASTGLTLAQSAHADVLLWVLLISAVVASVFFKVNPLWLLAGAAVIGIAREAMQA
jgi:chromate transporter